MEFPSPLARTLWLELSRALQVPVEVRVLAADDDGLRVQLGATPGIIALEEIDIVPEAQPQRLVGRTVRALVVRSDPAAIVLSRRAYVEAAWRAGAGGHAHDELLLELRALVRSREVGDGARALIERLIAGPRRPAVAPQLAEFLELAAPPELRAVILAWALHEAHELRVGRLHMDDRWLGRSRAMPIWIKDGPGPHDGCVTRGETRRDVFVLGRGASGFVVFRRDAWRVHDEITHIDGWTHVYAPGARTLASILS